MPAGRIGCDLLGSEALFQQLREMPERFTRALAAGVYREGHRIRGDSMDRVPVDRGVLRAAHYVTLPEIQGTRVTVEVGTGGPAEPYAEIVHERMDVAHEVGGAKFLEAAVDSCTAGFAERIAERTARALERLTGPLPPMPASLGYETPNNPEAMAAAQAAARKQATNSALHRSRGSPTRAARLWGGYHAEPTVPRRRGHRKRR